MGIAADKTEHDIWLLLNVIHEKYGQDFRQYSRSHVWRRVQHRMTVSGFKTIEQLRQAVMNDEQTAALFLQDFSVAVTELFRDPPFFRAVREHVIPILKTYPFIKVWHAGCATGEEVYSMAILLMEEGLYDRSIIYATDFSEIPLNDARNGIYKLEDMNDREEAYREAGGTRTLSDYYTSSYDHVLMNGSLRKNIVWANHNLVTDRVFAEVNIIFCRNVLIYFEKSLQEKVHGLFHDALVRGGILCLGSLETLKFTSYESQYRSLDEEHRIFKKRM